MSCAACPATTATTQARYLEATIGDLRVASIYLPNGNPVDTDKFAYKLAWMERLEAHARRAARRRERAVRARRRLQRLPDR